MVRLQISLLVVLLLLTSNIDENEIQIRQIINNFQTQIGPMRISSTALVTAKKGNIYAVLFHKISDFDLNTLCKYIYDKLINISVAK